MTSNSSPLERKLWNDWTEKQDNDTANEIIRHYTYLVRFHVERVSSHLPSNVSKDDIQSLGLLGLYDALKKFEPHRDLKFDTYASFRVRGAIMDGLRKEDWLPRSVRDKTKKVEQTAIKLEQQLQRKAQPEEIARELDMTSQEVETVVKDALFANVLSIEEKAKGKAPSYTEQQEGIGYIIPDEKAVLPEKNIEDSELKRELAESMEKLKENEQMVISLFYHDELTLTEIGRVLGLTTSRISQIHRKAIFQLKSILEKVQ